MRELILLRHAHAEPATTGQADLDRPLSAQGLAEAEAAGRWLKEHGYTPDRVVCSSARRTRETTEQAMAALGFVETRQEIRIYDATPGRLMQVVDENRDASRLLLVGHNPGFEQLAALMYSGVTSEYRGMPPGGVVVLTLPVDAAIEPGVAQLSAFWWP